MEAMRGAGDVASTSPGFTAINKLSPQLGSSHRPSTTSQIQQNTTKACITRKSSRRRNLAVASYLGLGDLTEPAHLAVYAPTPDGHSPPPQSSRKRRVVRKGDKVPMKKAKATTKKASSQERVTDKPKTKSLSQPVIHELIRSGEVLLPTPTSTSSPARQHINHQEENPHIVTMSNSTTPQSKAPGRHAAVSGDDDNDDDDDFGQLCFDFESNVSTTNKSSCRTQPSEFTQVANIQFDEDDFDDDIVDGDLVDLNSDIMDVSSCSNLHSSSPVKEAPFRQTHVPGMSADSADMLDETVDNSLLDSKKVISPVTLTTPLLATTGDEAPKPFVRPAFPTVIRDHSPVIGMSSNKLLRTCFRVGEAINQSCQAARTGNTILIELYARVLNSERDDLQQRFTFCDLFHAKPPYIQATYAAAIWKSVRLFDYDSARLLQQGRICRCIGTMKRNGKDWAMTVLNIWEATWDDVEWVKGTVQS